MSALTGPNYASKDIYTELVFAKTRVTHAEPCSGCMYKIATETTFDDMRTLAEDYFGDNAHVHSAGGRRYYKYKTRQPIPLMATEKLSKIVRSSGRTVTSWCGKECKK